MTTITVATIAFFLPTLLGALAVYLPARVVDLRPSFRSVCGSPELDAFRAGLGL